MSLDARLFVYGTLAPGRSNHHVVAPLGGTWQAASVRGALLEEGWGAALGYPGLIPDEDGERVVGQLLTADALTDAWPMLDAFEGSGYVRQTIDVTLEDGTRIEAYVYALSERPG